MRGVIPPWLPVAFVAVPLSGCANLAPDRAQPELTAQIPSDFPNSESVGDYRPEAWWTAFDDPVLDALVRDALADNLDAAANLFLGRELTSALGLVDDSAMEAETRKIMARLNPNFRKFNVPVSALSGGQRQSVAIARAVYFNARILIMDEPTAALGVHETAMVADLIKELKAQGLGIFLISHDTREMLDLCDRVSVMKNGQLVGTERVEDVTEDDILSMIILGKNPKAAA
mgnify:CR=1 FL=1